MKIATQAGSYSRIQVDMALEQSVNATSNFTSIKAFSNSESARGLWMLTRSLKIEIVSSLFERIGTTALFTDSLSVQRFCVTNIPARIAVLKPQRSLIYLVIIKK